MGSFAIDVACDVRMALGRQADYGVTAVVVLTAALDGCRGLSRPCSRRAGEFRGPSRDRPTWRGSPAASVHSDRSLPAAKFVRALHHRGMVVGRRLS